MNDPDDEIALRHHICLRIYMHLQQYTDTHVPDVHTNMPLQELKQIYQQAKDEVNEFHLNKKKMMKQDFKDALVKELLKPINKEIDINSKILFDGLNEYMTENGISYESTKMAFIDLFVELFVDLVKSNVTSESTNGDEMIDSFCNQYQLTIDRNRLSIIVNALPILVYG